MLVKLVLLSETMEVMSTPLYQLPGTCRVQGEFILVTSEDLISVESKVC